MISANKRINFTIDLQFQRNRTGTNSQGVNMPTALDRAGDFPQTLVQGSAVKIYYPLSGLPFVDSKIPLTRINPAATALLKYFPDPNLPFGNRNYQTSWTTNAAQCTISPVSVLTSK